MNLRKDSEWGKIDSEPCRVRDFVPLALVNNGVVSAPNSTDPYAYVILECKKIQGNIKGYVTHKIDFLHLWRAFEAKGTSENEEVIIFWSKKQLKTIPRLFSVFMPKLWVIVCRKGAFEIMSDPKWKPELTIELRKNAVWPIYEWRPRVLKQGYDMLFSD